jgi:hypothetical protein
VSGELNILREELGHILLKEGRTTSVSSEEEFFNILQKDGTSFNKIDQVLYRAIRGRKGMGEELLYGETKGSSRPKSPYATNQLAHAILTGSPMWKSYPKRSHSFICSSLLSTAKSYSLNGEEKRDGSTYVVIPLGNYPMGVCPSFDMWSSFEEAEKSYKGLSIEGPGNLDTFMTVLEELTDSIQRDLYRYFGLVDMDYSSFASWAPKYIDDILKNYPEKVELVKKFRWLDDKFKNMLLKDGLVKTVLYYMNPSKNGFKKIKFSSYSSKVYEDQELWTEAPCLFVWINEWFKGGFKDKVESYLQDR